MCKRSGKTTDHLLLHCPVTREMWNIVFSLFGINWVMPRGVVELLASWPSKFNRHRNEAIWGMTLIASWGICWDRNARTFEGHERFIPNLKLLFLKTLFKWIIALGVFTFVYLPDLLDSCTFHASF